MRDLAQDLPSRNSESCGQFLNKGSVTAGNSSQMSDGAAATVVMSREKAEALGADILGILRDFVVVGVEPDEMGIGPACAVTA